MERDSSWIVSDNKKNVRYPDEIAPRSRAHIMNRVDKNGTQYSIKNNADCRIIEDKTRDTQYFVQIHESGETFDKNIIFSRRNDDNKHR